MLTKREILNSYIGKELNIHDLDSGLNIRISKFDSAYYDIITKIGDELFEVEHHFRSQKDTIEAIYYCLDKVVKIEKIR
jgi:hypothetical protein